jgi:5-methyltetrahydropteroyltriglutamate--homocysteine methyltransferase
MQRSTERILTTHTGSLPRPAELLSVFTGDRQVTESEFADLAQHAVADVVANQLDSGIDVVNDGEMSKEGYSTYVRQRLSGFEGHGEAVLTTADVADFPGYEKRLFQTTLAQSDSALQPPACVGEISVKDRTRLQQDIDNLKNAAAGTAAQDVFMSAASPGVIAAFFVNHYYPTREEFLQAIGEAMREEYETIAAAGFVLQLDAPDQAMCRHLQFQQLSTEEFRTRARYDIEVLNHATRNIDPEQMRMHLCWGNYEGPHHYDVALTDVIDTVLTARPNGLLLEAANPRHEHEWRVFQDVKLPDGKVLIPGVIDSTMNYIEHPDLIAQRLVRYGSLVGRENIMAGSDCGFGTFAATAAVDPQITWAKFRSMAQGAKRATEELKRSAHAA